MGSGFLKKKKQAKLFQQQLSQMQDSLSAKFDTIEVTGVAGNGLVTVVLTGGHEMKSIRIKPECVDPEDVEGLETLIKAAYEDAANKAKSAIESDTSFGSSFPSLMT